jgi:hypothetical protein
MSNDKYSVLNAQCLALPAHAALCSALLPAHFLSVAEGH